MANRMERTEGWVAAQPYWRAIEAVADPRSSLDAEFIEKAARFRLRGHDFVGARRLLSSVAPTLHEAKIYSATGFLLAQNEPIDRPTALKYWRKSLRLNSSRPEVLDAIAWAIVTSEDSTVGRPAEARDMASRAVALDRRRIPEFLRTLACAHYQCGATDKAIAWMRLAIRRNPKHVEAYASELAEFEQEWAAAKRR